MIYSGILCRDAQKHVTPLFRIALLIRQYAQRCRPNFLLIAEIARQIDTHIWLWRDHIQNTDCTSNLSHQKRKLQHEEGYKKKATKMIKMLENLPYKGRLKCFLVQGRKMIEGGRLQKFPKLNIIIVIILKLGVGKKLMVSRYQDSQDCTFPYQG